MNDSQEKDNFVLNRLRQDVMEKASIAGHGRVDIVELAVAVNTSESTIKRFLGYDKSHTGDYGLNTKNLFCKYLGFGNLSEYAKSISEEKPKHPEDHEPIEGMGGGGENQEGLSENSLEELLQTKLLTDNQILEYHINDTNDSRKANWKIGLFSILGFLILASIVVLYFHKAVKLVSIVESDCAFSASDTINLKILVL